MTTWRFSRRNNDPPQVKTSDYPEKAAVGLSSALRTHVSSFRYRHNGTRGTPPSPQLAHATERSTQAQGCTLTVSARGNAPPQASRSRPSPAASTSGYQDQAIKLLIFALFAESLLNGRYPVHFTYPKVAHCLPQTPQLRPLRLWLCSAYEEDAVHAWCLCTFGGVHGNRLSGSAGMPSSALGWFDHRYQRQRAKEAVC